MTRRLTSTYANVLDMVRTMNRTRRAGITTSNERLNLKLKALNKKQVVRALFIILTGSFGLTYVHPAVAASTANQINAYRVYAHSRIFVNEQYLCFDQLIQKESHYNDKAINGDHYGLVQGKSKSLISMSGYQQIDWAIAYIHNRYKSECNALRHSSKYGWY
jgi:hypothetical protein